MLMYRLEEIKRRKKLSRWIRKCKRNLLMTCLKISLAMLWSIKDFKELELTSRTSDRRMQAPNLLRRRKNRVIMRPFVTSRSPVMSRSC